eukprot:2253862-Rhodomonas_salina.1
MIRCARLRSRACQPWSIHALGSAKTVGCQVGVDYAAAFGDERKSKVCMHGMSSQGWCCTGLD